LRAHFFDRLGRRCTTRTIRGTSVLVARGIRSKTAGHALFRRNPEATKSGPQRRRLHPEQGRRAIFVGAHKQPQAATASSPVEFEPIKILGIIDDEVGTPRNDGTRGSALYVVRFRLSRPPWPRWGRHFVQTRENPPSFTTQHRAKIARVEGDRVILDGTTVEEVARFHRDTVKIVLAKANDDIAEMERRSRRLAEDEAERQRQHRQAVLASDKTTMPMYLPCKNLAEEVGSGPSATAMSKKTTRVLPWPRITSA
jgi:hypothetical protein